MGDRGFSVLRPKGRFLVEATSPQSLLNDNKTFQLFQLMYGKKMKLNPSRIRSKRSSSYDNNRQWVFLGSKEKMKSVATLASVSSVISDPQMNSTYYTPNGYYQRNNRLTETLRWLNAFVFDIDSSGESILDIMDRLALAGLPKPTAIVKTPSGGFHVTYIFSEPVRATPNAIRLYTAIMSHISKDIGGDPAAVGANRIFRTPDDDTLIYFQPDQVHSFDFFKDWREINHPYIPAVNYRIIGGDIMNTTAVQSLLNSPCKEGKRDRTCFTLALAMKASNWPIDVAEAAIQEWHSSNCLSQTCRAGKKALSLREALYKVKYVYSKSKLVGPSAEMIRELSGHDFHFPAHRHYEGPKSRENRLRSHYAEWKDDFLSLLCEKKVLSGTQTEIATLIKCPLSSFKLIINMLEKEDLIEVETKRGRGGKTIIRLVKNEEKETDREKEKAPSELKNTTVYVVDFVNKILVNKVLFRQKSLSENQRIIGSIDDSDPPPD